MSTTMNAGQIVDLLREKHDGDVFVPECKGGPTWAGLHDRLDAWAMRKSWARPIVWGYEIKVSRSDFLRDEKWQAYLQYCNEFYFVAPKGVIDKQELPPEAGLLQVASTGTCLRRVKLATRRAVTIPEELYRYLLFSRTVITSDHPVVEQTRADKIRYWQQWLEERQQGRFMGYAVSRAVREHVEAVDAENRRLRDENAALALFKERLDELRVNPHFPVATWQVEQAMRTLRGEIPPLFIRALRTVREGIDTILEELTGTTDRTG